MKAKLTATLAGMTLVGVAIGCFVGGADEQQPVSSAGAGGATAAPDGSSAPAVGGRSGATPTSGESETCPRLPGPTLVKVPAPDGTSYCIDSTEVSQSQYAEFLAKVEAKPGTEHPECERNETYAPLNNPPGIEWEPNLCVDSFTPDKTPSRPVVCVSWCDAYAYCTWAGKRLCGKIGGGSGELDPGTVTEKSPNDPAVSATSSQWYNACSQGGKTAYPYGDTYNFAACEGEEAWKAEGWTKQDVGARASCSGAHEPFNHVLDMSGSVAELTDECIAAGALGTECAVRGGGMAYPASRLSCSSYSSFSPRREAEDVGFRCCRDLP